GVVPADENNGLIILRREAQLVPQERMVRIELLVLGIRDGSCRYLKARRDIDLVLGLLVQVTSPIQVGLIVPGRARSSLQEGPGRDINQVHDYGVSGNLRRNTLGSSSSCCTRTEATF